MPAVVAALDSRHHTPVHPALPDDQQLAITLERQLRRVVLFIAGFRAIQPAIGGQAICVVDEEVIALYFIRQAKYGAFFESITTAPMGPSPIRN
jgi:hypothetical protein